MVSEILCNLHLSITYQAYGTRALSRAGFLYAVKGWEYLKQWGIRKKTRGGVYDTGGIYMRTEGDFKNPRSANGNLRRKNRTRLRAMGEVCYICGKPIHYDEPSDSKHPLSFVIDEVIPVSRWKEFGYNSPREVAEDFNNLKAAHWICNQKKSNKTPTELSRLAKPKRLINLSDGQW